ncbi:putative cytochrome P450 [Mycobacterium xenopi 4042]|uniref:Putative cytochrome P450 n=1 Tax=Mycobacterium xenopi 4042 TaxID=1299334 RepID=X8AHR0_MYCXE|nr:putative cytochrome P450 [Mycobacterium xenopi 4042]
MIADLLGVPDADRDDFVQNLHRHVGGGLGSTEGSPWRTARWNSSTAGSRPISKIAAASPVMMC